MSRILEETGVRELSHVVESRGKFYFVDSNDTYDRSYETMVFPCDKDGGVLDWGDLYCKLYETEEEMKKHHFEVCNNLEEYL